MATVMTLCVLALLCISSRALGLFPVTDTDHNPANHNQNFTGQELTRMRYDNSFNDPSNASLYIQSDLLRPQNRTRGQARALDLDALLGEPSNAPRQTGDRESRIINEKPSLNIQGFIPIVTLNKDQKRPESHTSIGHQSFLPHYEPPPPPPAATGHFDTIYGRPQEEPKFIGGALQGLASALRPKRKGYDGVPGHDCLCVPFYMCKNGYLESSTAKNYQNQHSDETVLKQQFAVAESEAQKNFADIPPQLSSFYQQHRPQDQYQASPTQLDHEKIDLPLDERSIDGKRNDTHDVSS